MFIALVPQRFLQLRRSEISSVKLNIAPMELNFERPRDYKHRAPTELATQIAYCAMSLETTNSFFTSKRPGTPRARMYANWASAFESTMPFNVARPWSTMM